MSLKTTGIITPFEREHYHNKADGRPAVIANEMRVLYTFICRLNIPRLPDRLAHLSLDLLIPQGQLEKEIHEALACLYGGCSDFLDLSQHLRLACFSLRRADIKLK
jgi:hypothetical protein